MNFDLDNKEEFTLVKCNVDKLDTTVAPELKSQFLILDKSGVINYILDLTDVKYCDSSGLSAMLVANRFAKNMDGCLVIFGLQPMVEKMITISQLHSVLNITKTKAEAVEFILSESHKKGA